MADQTDTAARAQLREFRRIVADVVTELRSAEVVKTFAAVTLVELADKHVAYLTGGTPQKPSRLQRIEAVYKAYKGSIDAIKAVPPTTFRSKDPDTDANTAP